MSEPSSTPSDWWIEFLKHNPVPQASLDHFASIPSTNKYLADSAYRPIPHFSRSLKPTGEDYFFSTTVAGPRTLDHFICLQRREYRTLETLKSFELSGSAVEAKNLPAPSQPDCIFLFTVGPSGLDGHPGVLHGGMCCAILDESMGVALLLHAYNLEGRTRQSQVFTAYLNVTYRAPVSTPGHYAVTAWLTHRQGKKWRVRGQILDHSGKICAEGEGLWISVPKNKI